MPLSRRRFHMSVAAAAASALTLRSQQTPGRKIGYCIIGLGRISMNEFMPGVEKSEHCRITGLVSGHRDKAEKMAAKYGVPPGSIYTYEEFDRKMASNSAIDAVYVALPNSMHAEYTVRSAQAGKHVLCEKPMATSAAEAQQMISACERAAKKLMIAYRCQLEPNTLKAQETVRSGSIGRVELIDSSFGFNIARGEWRLNKTLAGGGPLMDVGIYCLQACRIMSGEEPAEVDARWSVLDKDGRFNEVEENLVWSMRFPSGLLTTCNTSYGTNTGGWFRVYGSKGMIELQPAFSYSGLKLQINGKDATVEDHDPMHFVREADHFAKCILENTSPKTAGQEGLTDLRIMESIYRSCRDQAPVKLPA